VEATGKVVVADHRSQPKILLAASTWWPASARLAMSLALNGCVVSALCPPGHPLRYLGNIKQLYKLRGMRSRASLLAAIRSAKPDFIIPCDDRIVSQLHELYSLHAELRPLIAYSLGDPRGFDIADSRSALLKVAADLDIRVPRGAIVTTEADAKQSFQQFAPVAVMKLDGTHGGEGVRIVRSADEAAAAFRSLRVSTGLLTAAHRLLIHGDQLAPWSWSRRARSELTIQEYIQGTPANNMVACWQGETLAEVGVEAVSCQGPTGSANVVRRVDNPKMTRAAKLIAAHLGASGFFGLDFISDHRTGEPYLIEMNPRCTQLGHLEFADRAGLARALSERITGQGAPPAQAPIPCDLVAFFPQAWRSSTRGDEWYSSFQDVPWEEQSLVEYLMLEPWPKRRWQVRAYRSLRGRKAEQH
jgi:ATP-grasp domain